MKTKTKGQSLVEFALILPILLLLILGIIEGARIIWAYITVQNAAREAARYAVVGQPYDDAGNPWTLRPDRYSGCNPGFDQGRLEYEGCDGPNDRVDAIIGVAMERGRSLGIDELAIYPGVYTATGYVDKGGTYGVRVFGQETLGGHRVDYAGTEGLNVLVQVYYNVRLLDPLYAAIIPDGFVHLAGEVQMQNEGLDSALGAIPPEGIEPPQAPEGQPPPPPGQTNRPIVISLDGSTVDAGSPLTVKLDYHTANQSYDIYLYSLSLGYALICSSVDAGVGSAIATCNVPPETVAGSYQLVSIEAGVDADPANHFGEGDLIDVMFPGEPLLQIAESSRWPPGSTITFQLFGHPPTRTYDIALIGGVAGPSPGRPIADQVPVDVTGSGSLVWSIPDWLEIGTYRVVTYESPTTGTSEPVADTVLEIAPAEIVIQGGNTWPAGTTIRVQLRSHAPNRTYRLRWIDGDTGASIDFGPVTTNQFGDSEIPVQFPIPPNTANGVHRIVSFEDGGSDVETASTNVMIDTPVNPFIVVVGGDTWPAGSLIQIELHKHYPGPFNIYFDNGLIANGSNIYPPASGFYQTTHTIPITTSNGTYGIWTEQNNTEVASTTIKVESVPLISLEQGSVVQPGSVIRVQLDHHPPNDSFDIYLDGNEIIRGLPTGPGGSEICSIDQCVYDLSGLPGLEGGPFLLESRAGGLTVAATEIFILTPDLLITDIKFPPGPPTNEPITVTVTISNSSRVPVSGKYFDVDLYLDPLHPPTPSSPFPPGDYKLWVDGISPMATREVEFNVTLSGTDHTVYGRVDTSDGIAESNEFNNIYQMTVSGGCVAEITDALGNAASWSGKWYGSPTDAPGPPSVSGGVISLTSRGLVDFLSSDNMYLAYYNPQTVSGDFEVRVRMAGGPVAASSQGARGGLEIREDVESPSSAKVELAVANSQHVGSGSAVQSVYRHGDDITTMRAAATDVAVSYPVWLRIARSGDSFTYYYSDSDSDTPPAEGDWIQHGSAQMADIGGAVTVGLFNASGSLDASLTSSFDKFHICLKGSAGPPPDFPPGLTVCTNVIQNGGFEGDELAPWRAPNGAVDVKTDFSPGFEGEAALMYTYRQQEPHHQPVLAQTFSMPAWINPSTTIDLSLYYCVRDYPGSGPEPDDDLYIGLRSTGNPPEAVFDPIWVADGDTGDSGPCLSTDYTLFPSDWAQAMVDAGKDPQSYAGQPLELYLYDTSSDPSVCRPPTAHLDPTCYETDFYVDEVALNVCTTQATPDPENGKAYRVGGQLRVFIGGAPQPKQGVWVWMYKADGSGSVLTTYSLQDSNYFFYNVDPGDYIIYSEYWDGPNLYSAFTAVRVSAGAGSDNENLLLR